MNEEKNAVRVSGTSSYACGVGLHDCRADSCKLTDGRIIFTFNAGVSLLSGENDELSASGHTQLIISGASELNACLFRRRTIFGKKITERVELSAAEFERLVNADGAQLEFLSEYHSDGSLTAPDGHLFRHVLFECCLWQNKRPHCVECELCVICYDSFEYSWEK